MKPLALPEVPATGDPDDPALLDAGVEAELVAAGWLVVGAGVCAGALDPDELQAATNPSAVNRVRTLALPRPLQDFRGVAFMVSCLSIH